MLIKPPSDVRSSEICDKATYLNRRAFIRAAIGAVGVGALAGETAVTAQQPAAHGRKLENIRTSPLSTTERPNTWQQITTYNNFYEFGLDKQDAATYSKSHVVSARTWSDRPQSVSPARTAASAIASAEASPSVRSECVCQSDSASVPAVIPARHREAQPAR